MDEVSYEDFKKLDLRVGVIGSAERVGEKTYKLSVDIGKNITLVAGIARSYTERELIGKKIIVIANLEPAVIRNIESQGMLLAAEDKENNISLVTLDKDLKPGTKIF